MLKKILFISFVLFSGSVFAEDGNVYNLTQFWGNGQVTACGENTISGVACIGESKGDGCGAKNEVLMMVARKINEYCAKFCPTELVEGSGYETIYYDARKGDDCVWLCRDGNWANLDTTIESPDNYCENDLLKYSNYESSSDYSITKEGEGGNIEGTIARFMANEDRDCGSHDNEHDMILAITRYLSSGHGAYVQQMVARATSNAVNVYSAGTANEILVCRPGYKPVAGDCVQATNFCELENYFKNMCTDWSSAYFDSNIHKFEKKGKCYIYKCKTPGYAFPDTEGNVSDYSCSKCIEVVNKDGINPHNGACVHCETGKVFEEYSNNYACLDAQQLTRQELQYGKGKTTQDDIRNLSLNEQCWIKDITDDYYECVLHKTKDSFYNTNSADAQSVSSTSSSDAI